MRVIRFLAALLVLASFTLPWIHVVPGALSQTGVSADSTVSFMSLFRDSYSPSAISELASDISDHNYCSVVYALGILFVGLGAVIGLASRAGHFVGILGMVMVSYFFIKVAGLSFFTGGSPVGMQVGYFITWLGFLIGVAAR